MSTEIRQHKDIQGFLHKLGLSDKESKAYLYCLIHGPQLVTRLGQLLGTTRTNTYDIIKKLETKGLCHSVGGAYGKKIRANDPKDISYLLENKKKEIDGLKSELDDLLPMFGKVSKESVSPFTRVSYFDGIDSVKKMLWMSLQAKNKIIRIAGSEIDIASSLGKEYLVDYHTRRKNNGVSLKALRPDSKRLDGAVFKNDKEFLRELRIRPKGKIRLKSSLILWDNCVALYSLKENIVFGTLIESDDMAVMFETWFDTIWEISAEA